MADGSLPGRLLYSAGKLAGTADRQCGDPVGNVDAADYDTYGVLCLPAAF